MSPDDVIYFDSEKNPALFDSADVKSHFWTLCRYFVSEEFSTYCGIASGVTVLNSLGIKSPDAPQIYPYKMFTQDNFFSDAVLRVRRPHDVEKNGWNARGIDDWSIWRNCTHSPFFCVS